MIPEEKIEPALRKIEMLIAEQCAHGSQNAGLDGDSAACGQFIGPKAKKVPQRGLHGTAGALRVLAESSTTGSGELVQKLITYIQKRPDLHSKGQEKTRGNHTFEDDQTNVIKLSEILYGLSFVKAAQGQKEVLVRSLAQKLLTAQKEKKGWAHFLSSSAPIDPLPTAFAVLALCRHGFENDLAQAIAFLKETVNRKTDSGNRSEASVRILALFALAFRSDELSPGDLRDYRHEFSVLWDHHERLFAEDVEQNIEYWNEERNYYVRIPWQLYLLALAARLDSKIISGLSAQRALDRVATKTSDGGFVYPYSGEIPSARTNAIVYDVLQKVKRFGTRNAFYKMYYGFDRIRNALGHRGVSLFMLAVSVGAAAYCIYSWKAKSGSPADIAPDVMGAIIALVVSAFYERLKKRT